MKQNGVRGLVKTGVASVQFLNGELRYRRTHKEYSTNIYERDWDLLILLDCATIEMMEEVADEYDFVENVGNHISPGTCSDEWMGRTFISDYDQEMDQTLHVTANTPSEIHLDSNQFFHLEEVWKDGWNKELGTITAREVTDRTIHFAREHDA